MTALLWASRGVFRQVFRRGHLDVVKYFVSEGATIDQATNVSIAASDDISVRNTAV